MNACSVAEPGAAQQAIRRWAGLGDVQDLALEL
jgi:hypothetical protein